MTRTSTRSPTGTPTISSTPSYSATVTPSGSSTGSATSSATRTYTASATPTATSVVSTTPSPTGSATPDFPTATATPLTGDLVRDVSNYPNPFWAGRESTTLMYRLREDSEVELEFFDYLGNRILKLRCFPGSEGGRQGLNRIRWDGKDGKGIVVGAGGYLCRIKVETRVGESERRIRKIGVVWER